MFIIYLYIHIYINKSVLIKNTHIFYFKIVIKIYQNQKNNMSTFSQKILIKI